MASDDKKTKATPAPKSEPPAKDKSASGTDTSKTKSGEATAAPVAAKDGELPAAPSSYSRGEGQKPVSQAYKDNWNAIFAKKKKKR